MKTNEHDFKFFIVDDDRFYSMIYEQCLRNMRYENIVSFSNGEECLHELHDKPDIVFLDYEMEGLNGYQVLKKIKKFDPNIYVIMVSGQENIDVAVNAFKYGAFEYIVKDANICKKISIALENIVNIKEEITSNNSKA